MPSDFLSVDEAAVLLGVNRKTLYALAKKGKLPGARHLGRCIRVHRETLLEFFRQGASHPRG